MNRLKQSLKLSHLDRTDMVILITAGILAIVGLVAALCSQLAICSQLDKYVDKSALIGVVSIIIAFLGICLAVKQVILARETEVLEGIDEIVKELKDKIIKAKEEILFMAATPAIGASGGARDITRNLLNAWENKIKEFGNNKLNKAIKVICYNLDILPTFYEKQGVSYKNTLVETLNVEFFQILKGKEKDKEKDIVDIVSPKTFCEIPYLHFLIVDPEKSEERAVCWYLSPERVGKISGVGFSTFNRTVVRTLVEVFKQEFEEISGQKSDPCNDEKKLENITQVITEALNILNSAKPGDRCLIISSTPAIAFRCSPERQNDLNCFFNSLLHKSKEEIPQIEILCLPTDKLESYYESMNVTLSNDSKSCLESCLNALISLKSKDKINVIEIQDVGEIVFNIIIYVSSANLKKVLVWQYYKASSSDTLITGDGFLTATHGIVQFFENYFNSLGKKYK